MSNALPLIEFTHAVVRFTAQSAVLVLKEPVSLLGQHDLETQINILVAKAVGLLYFTDNIDTGANAF